MTDRIKGLVVTLDKDYRSDDVQSIVNAIMMVKGVLNVSKNVADVNDYINRAKTVHKIREKFLEILSSDNLKLD